MRPPNERRVDRRAQLAGGFVIGLALAAVLAHSPAPAAVTSSDRAAAAGAAPGERATHVIDRSRPAPASRENLDADARDFALSRRHALLLRAEPLLQRLPYRDHELGVQLVGTTRSGRPLLLATYRGSLTSARHEMGALLLRLDDGGTEYVTRYERLHRD